jgi:hypothetical protein
MCYSIDAQVERFVRFRTLKTTQKEEEERKKRTKYSLVKIIRA